nr:uncharacterized protein LOC113724067 [Coffea arabica]
MAEGVSFGSSEMEVDQAKEVGKAGKVKEIAKDAHTRLAAKALQAQETTKATQAQEAVEVLRTGDTAEVAQTNQVAEVGQAEDAAKAEQAREAAEVGQAGDAAEATRTREADEVGQAKEAAETEQTQETAKAELAKEAAQTRKATEAAGRTEPIWTLYVNGASSREGCGAGLLLINPTEEELAYALRFDFRVSNNEIEYETLIAGMEMARKLGAESIKIYSDSQLIVNQVLGSYEVKEGPLRKYIAKMHELMDQFKQFTLEQIPRSQNKRADALSKLASTLFSTLNQKILVEVVKSRAYEQLNTTVI